jgi:molecular chaperone GrpE
MRRSLNKKKSPFDIIFTIISALRKRKRMPDKKNKAKAYESEQPLQDGDQTAAPTANPSEELETLKSQLVETQSKTQEYLDALQRERADFMNYRRRTELEISQISRNASGNTIRKFLAAIDDLERALAHRPEDDVWANGVELVYRKFLAILEAEGVMRIQAEGQPFDPNLHEAIMQEPSESSESGIVTAVLQQGYMHGERVLRPALVKVAQ